MQIQLITSPRRKKIALKINQSGELEVHAPVWLSENEMQKLLLQHKDVVENLQKKALLLQKKRPVFAEASSLLYLGDTYPIFTSIRLRQFDGERFMIPAGSETERLDTVEKIYRLLAVRYLVPRSRELAERFGIQINEIRINSAVTRWGSCSARGNLNFSWHLIRCPKELVDSVICHELAHRKVLNHSPAFYQQLRQFDPLYAEHRTALNHFIRQNPWFR